MNDEEICRVLDRAFQDLGLGLYFQVSQNSPYLYVFINRPVGSALDYDRITALVGETIAGLELENLPYMALYSRPVGEVEPDWEICSAISDFDQKTVVVNLDEKDLRAISNAALSNTPFDPPFDETSNDESNDEITEFVSHRASQPFTDLEPDSESYAQDHQGNVLPAVNLEPEQDLKQDNFSHYCFVDDRNALSLSNPEISPKVAKALVIFHRFPTRGKHRVLPLLGQIFEGDRGIVFIHFPEQVQQWFEYILTLTAVEIQGAKFWFSRYCQDSRSTLRKMQALLKQSANQSPVASETVEPVPRNPLLTVDARTRTDTPPVSSRSSPARTGPTDQRSPQKLWLWLVLLGVGSLCLGAITTVFYRQGLGVGGWIFLLLTIVLQTFSTATANRALQKVQGGIFTTALILRAIFSSDGLVGGYIAGLLLGLAVGNILKFQFLNTQKSLPQNVTGIWELLSDRTGTIAFAIALISFSCPLILFTAAEIP